MIGVGAVLCAVAGVGLLCVSITGTRAQYRLGCVFCAVAAAFLLVGAL